MPQWQRLLFCLGLVKCSFTESKSALAQDCLRWLLAHMIQAWPSRQLARHLPELYSSLLAHVSASCVSLASPPPPPPPPSVLAPQHKSSLICIDASQTTPALPNPLAPPPPPPPPFCPCTSADLTSLQQSAWTLLQPLLPPFPLAGVPLNVLLVFSVL